MVGSRASAEQAIEQTAQDVSQSHDTSLAVAVAKRAIVQSHGDPEPGRGFVAALFAETTNYLVSRDLPGFVQKEARNQTVTQAVQFKRSIREEVRQRVLGLLAEVPPPEKHERKQWSDFVSLLVERLAE